MRPPPSSETLTCGPNCQEGDLQGHNTTYLFLSCSDSTSARTDLLARVTLAFLLTLTLPTRDLPASGSFSVLESSKLARLALLLSTQDQSVNV